MDMGYLMGFSLSSFTDLLSGMGQRRVFYQASYLTFNFGTDFKVNFWLGIDKRTTACIQSNDMQT
jgi:hypothetical protein